MTPTSEGVVGKQPNSRNRPRVLVALAAYNGRKWLEEQVTSILHQQDAEVSVVISVDQSKDGTEAWISELAQREPRVRFLPHGRKFGGAAPNFFRLIEEVDIEDFDYVALADQDDIWLPNKIVHAHNEISRRGVDAYSSDVLAFWPDGREQVIKKSQPQVSYDYLFEAAGPGCTYVLTVKLVQALKANIADHTALIKNVTLHDWYIYAFARANGYSWYIDDVLCMRYRQHQDNQVGVNTGLAAFKKRLGQVFDGWWLSQATLISELVGLSGSPFVKSWSAMDFTGLLKLAFRGRQCRRRLRDQCVFSLLCLMLAFRPLVGK